MLSNDVFDGLFELLQTLSINPETRERVVNLVELLREQINRVDEAYESGILTRFEAAARTRKLFEEARNDLTEILADDEDRAAWHEFGAALAMRRQAILASWGPEESTPSSPAPCPASPAPPGRGAREALERGKIVDISGTAFRDRALSTVGEEEHDEYVVIPVYYGTNRKPTGSSIANRFYGRQRTDRDGVELGLCSVSVPRKRKIGSIPRPRWWLLETREDPRRHVILKTVDAMLPGAFFARLAETIGRSDDKQALIFVHGFRTSFADAVRRTGQLARDLDFAGAPIAFAWPTRGSVLRGYLSDQQSALWSATYFEQFLEAIIDQSTADQVHLIAHSMGNRVVLEALNILAARRGDDQPMLCHVALAAPDVERGRFNNLAAALKSSARHVTLYVSSNDKALKAAHRLDDYPRAGDARGEPVVIDGIDTIDASAVNTGFLRHSFYAEERSVVTDLQGLIQLDLQVPRPGMEAIAMGALHYYAIRA